MNSVHKETKDLLYVMITLVTNISVGDTVIYDGVVISDLINRAHVLKHLHGIIIFVHLIFFCEINIWRGPRAVISFIIR